VAALEFGLLGDQSGWWGCPLSFNSEGTAMGDFEMLAITETPGEYHPEASIFVYPNPYHVILTVLPQHQLRLHHVVVCEVFLPLIYHELIKLPSRSREPRFPHLT